jgi:hypothetical protein
MFAASLPPPGEVVPCSRALHISFLPKSPVSGRVKPADPGAVESGSYEGGFWRFFGTALERTAGGTDADAQFPGDDLLRGAGRM